MTEQEEYRMMVLEPGGIEEVYVTYVEDPGHFYFQLSRTTDSVEDVGSKLMTHYKNSRPEDRKWNLGDLCAATCSEGYWNRAQITDIPDITGLVEVMFVDYGNKDLVEKKNLRTLHPDLLLTPVLSFHCCLEGVSFFAGVLWPTELSSKFKQLVLDKELSATIIDYDELQDVYQVQLCCRNGEIINQIICNELPIPHDGRPSAPGTNGFDQRTPMESSAQIKSHGIARSLGISSPGAPTSLPHLELKVGEKTNIFVVFVNSPAEWWCNVSRYAEVNEKMAAEMAKAYGAMSSSEGVLHQLRSGLVCAAVSQADGAWYRASIQKVTGPEVSVFFLDYGNSDIVPVGSVKELKEEFRSLPAQAVKCSLHGVAPSSGVWSEEASAEFEELVVDREFQGTVLEKIGVDRHVLSLMGITDLADTATVFLDKCSEATRARSRSSTPMDAVDIPKIPALTVQAGSKAKVYLTWVKTPSDFYVHLSDNQAMLDSLISDLQDFCNGPTASMASNLGAGTLVAAEHPVEKLWCRGLIKKVSGLMSEVEFIDYGNSEIIPAQSLLNLDQQFNKMPVLAVRCSLSGIRPLSQGSTWSGDAKDFLLKLTEVGAMCKFLRSKDGVHEVELETEGKDVAKEMVAHAVVRELSPDIDVSPKFQPYKLVQLARGQSHPVYMTFAESVESFYVQPADSMKALDGLMEELQNHYNAGKGKPLSNIMVGMPCAAKYDDDGSWYRAQVRSFTSRDIDVFFVDYGNTQSASGNAIAELEPNFLNSLEAQAIHCQLDVYEARNSEAKLEKLCDFTEEEELELVVKDKEGSKFLVDLLKDGVSLTNLLKSGTPVVKENVEKSRPGYTPGKVSAGQTVLAYASCIETPSRFWVQLAGCDDELTDMMETLSKHYGSGTDPPLPNPTPGQPCAALYDEDKQWYRASVMSVHGTEVKVLFVDYGNTELVDQQNIKPISAGFMSLPLLAIECCLDHFQSSSLSDDVVSAFESMISEQELSVTFNGPKNVSVKVGDTDVAQALQEKGFRCKSQKSPQAKTTPPKTSSGKSGSQSDSGVYHSPESGHVQKFKAISPPSGSAEAIITHVDNETGLFYVQLLSSELQLQQLSSDLQSVYGSGGPSFQGPPKNGMACCAKFTVDEFWYRALVEKVSGAKTRVQFVDYGNCDMVETSSLKPITADLLSYPVHAFPCKLKGLHSWTSQTARIFCKYALDEQLNVRFVTSSAPFDIQVSVNGQDLLQMIHRVPASPQEKSFGHESKSKNSRHSDHRQRSSESSEGGFRHGPSRQLRDGFQQESFTSVSEEKWKEQPLSTEHFVLSDSSNSSFVKREIPEQVFQPQQMPVEEEAAYVSHVSDDGTFYVQLVKDIDDIDELTTEIELYNLGPHPSLIVGAACGAMFSQDGCWYRGIIRSISGSSAEVLFVDFGNGETLNVKYLKALPDNLLMPAFAFQCQVDGLGLLTPEKQEAFLSASEDKEYLITFKKGVPFNVIVRDENGVNLADGIFKPTSIRPAPVPTETVHCVVAHVGEDGHFFLHLMSDMVSLTEFAEEVQVVCNAPEEKLDCYEEGQICCAKFTEDDCWYRATILKVYEDSASVFFVDYGNTDTVTKDSLLILPSTLMSKPAFAYDCKIPGIKRWKESQREKFVEMTYNKTMNARFLSEKVPYEVELTRSIGLELGEEDSGGESGGNAVESVPDSEDYSKTSEETENVPLVKCDELAEESSTAEKGPEQQISNEVKVQSAYSKVELPAQMPPALDACFISHIDQDGMIHLQLMSEDDIRENLRGKLQDECESPDTKPVIPSVGLLCCAKSTENEAWNRAVIEKVEGDIAQVQLIDTGNTDNLPLQNLKELSAENMQVPSLAYKCMLEDCELDQLCSKLREITLNQSLTVTFRTTETPPYTISLQLENGMDVSAMLGSAAQQSFSLEAAAANNFTGTADEDRKYVVLKHGQRWRVTVSHVTSPSLFYVQRTDSLDQLEENADAMYEHFSSLAEGDGVIENMAVNQLCASLFDEDESWYRAIVKDIGDDSCEVFFVDYGNSDWVPKSGVRELPAEFQELPWQSVCCSLVGVCCQEKEWSEEVKAAFEKLVISKSVLADVLSGDGVDEPYAAHILDLGVPVAKTLLDLNLPGVKATAVPELSSVKRFLSDTTADESEEGSRRSEEFNLDSSIQEPVESGLAEEVAAEGLEKETVDDVEENEQEFSRQLKACSAQMESTMMEEAMSVRQNVNSTVLEEPSAVLASEEKEEEDDEEVFEDAVDAEDGKSSADGDVVEPCDDQQTTYSCVADGLAELDWLDVHISVAVSASEFWCQLPSAHAVLSSSTMAIEKACTSETLKDIRVGHLYLVCDPPKTNYRAKVLSADCNDESKITVLKLDYGTEDTVPSSCVYPLAKHQLEIPTQAFCCCLDESENITATREWLDRLITQGEAVDKDMQVKVVGRKPNGTLMVDVREKPNDTSQLLSDMARVEAEVDASCTKKIRENETATDTLEISQPVLQSTVLCDTLSQSCMERSDGDRDYAIQMLGEGKEYEVSVAAGGRPDGFYITLVSAKGLLDALADDIEAEIREESENVAVCEQLVPGTPCLVQDKAASKWVRGLVKSSEDDYKVMCVDSGVVLDVGKDCIRELPSCLLDVPVQAIFCCLADITPVENQWCDSALAFFTDFVSGGPLKLTSSGLSERGTYQVTLHDESQSGGDATTSQLATESTVNRTLVELGYAEAVAGSALDVELQVERTINDPDKMEQLETSFSEVSCMRENSLGEDSDVEDGTEQEKDAVDASGDATNVFATESDEEYGTPPATQSLPETPDLIATVAGDTELAITSDDYVTDTSTSDTVCITPRSSEISVEGNVLTIDSTALAGDLENQKTVSTLYSDDLYKEKLEGTVCSIVGARSEKENIEEESFTDTVADAFSQVVGANVVSCIDVNRVKIDPIDNNFSSESGKSCSLSLTLKHSDTEFLDVKPPLDHAHVRNKSLSKITSCELAEDASVLVKLNAEKEKKDLVTKDSSNEGNELFVEVSVDGEPGDDSCGKEVDSAEQHTPCQWKEGETRIDQIVGMMMNDLIEGVLDWLGEMKGSISVEETVIDEQSNEPSPHVDAEPSLYVGAEPSPRVDTEPSLYVGTEPSPYVDAELSPHVDTEPSLYVGAKPSPYVYTDPSYVDTEPSPVDAEPSPFVDSEQSPSVDAEPSPYVDSEPSPSVDTEPSYVDTEPSPCVDTEPSCVAETCSHLKDDSDKFLGVKGSIIGDTVTKVSSVCASENTPACLQAFVMSGDLRFEESSAEHKKPSVAQEVHESIEKSSFGNDEMSVHEHEASVVAAVADNISSADGTSKKLFTREIIIEGCLAESQDVSSQITENIPVAEQKTDIESVVKEAKDILDNMSQTLCPKLVEHDSSPVLYDSTHSELDNTVIDMGDRSLASVCSEKQFHGVQGIGRNCEAEETNQKLNFGEKEEDQTSADRETKTSVGEETLSRPFGYPITNEMVDTGDRLKSVQETEVVSESTEIQETEVVSDSTEIQETEVVSDSTEIQEAEVVSDSTEIQETEVVSDSTEIQETEVVSDSTEIQETEVVSDSTEIQETEVVSESTEIQETEVVSESTEIQETEVVSDSTEIQETEVVSDSTVGQETEVISESTEIQETEVVSESTEIQETEVVSDSTEVQETEVVSESTEIQETEVVSDSTEIQETEVVSDSTEIQETEVVSESTEIQETEIVSESTEIQETEVVSESIEIQETEVVTDSTETEIVSENAMMEVVSENSRIDVCESTRNNVIAASDMPPLEVVREGAETHISGHVAREFSQARTEDVQPYQLRPGIERFGTKADHMGDKDIDNLEGTKGSFAVSPIVKFLEPDFTEPDACSGSWISDPEDPRTVQRDLTVAENSEEVETKQIQLTTLMESSSTHEQPVPELKDSDLSEVVTVNQPDPDLGVNPMDCSLPSSSDEEGYDTSLSQ